MVESGRLLFLYHFTLAFIQKVAQYHHSALVGSYCPNPFQITSRISSFSTTSCGLEPGSINQLATPPSSVLVHPMARFSFALEQLLELHESPLRRNHWAK
jgi:hypothetical protein